MGDGDAADDGDLPGPDLLRALAPFLCEAIEVVDGQGTVRHRLAPPDGVMGHGPRAGTSVFAYVHPDDLPRLMEFGTGVIESHAGDRDRLEVRVRHADGSWRPCEVVVENRLADPAIEGIVVRTRELPLPPVDPDVLASVAGGFAESIAEAVPMAMLVLDPWGRLEFANRAARELSPFESSDPRPRLVDLVLARGRSALADALDALDGRTGTRTVRVAILDRDGCERELEARLVAHGLPGRPSAVIAVLDDITERSREEAELRRRASRDPLTGVLNRTALIEEIERRLQHGPVTAIFCDLEGFKSVNDTLGHASGDDVLVRVAHLLDSMTKRNDAVGRFGGDEFVIVCDGLGAPATTALVRRLSTAVHDDLGVRLTMGVGGAPQGATAAELLASADEAMYRNKHQGALGRNR